MSFRFIFVVVILVGIVACGPGGQHSQEASPIQLSSKPSNERYQLVLSGTEPGTDHPCRLRVLSTRGQFSQRSEFRIRVQASFSGESADHPLHSPGPHDDHDDDHHGDHGNERFFPVIELAYHRSVQNLLHSGHQPAPFDFGASLAENATSPENLAGYRVGYTEFCSAHGHAVSSQRFCANLRVAERYSEDHNHGHEHEHDHNHSHP